MGRLFVSEYIPRAVRFAMRHFAESGPERSPRDSEG
jgi:hypothetical protein